MTEIRQRAEQAPLLPLSPSPTYSITTQRHGLPHPSEHLSSAPYYVMSGPRPKKKKMAQMKEQIKAPEKIQLSNEEIANLSDA